MQTQTELQDLKDKIDTLLDGAQEISEHCVTCGALADKCSCGDFVGDGPAQPHAIVAAMARHLLDLSAYLEPGSKDMFGEHVDAVSVKRQIQETMASITKAIDQI